MADETLSVAEGQFRSYFERWERLEEAKRVASDDLKAFFAEMKGEGYNPKAARVVFRDEVSDQAEAQEFEAICDLYRAALRKPRARPAHSARENIEQFGAAKGVHTAHIPVTDTQEQPVTTDQSDGDAFVAVKGSARFLTNAAGVEPSPSVSIPHSSADILPGKADQTGEAVNSPTASPVTPDGTKLLNTNSGSDPLLLHPSLAAGQAGAVTSLEDAPAPATNSAMNAKTKGDVIRLLRPFCAHADDLVKCGGQGSKHCPACEQAKRASIREDA